LVGKPAEKRPLGRPRHRWKDTVNMVHKEIGCEDVDSVHMAQNMAQWRALVNAVMSLRDL
jgi:hypothetical protein